MLDRNMIFWLLGGAGMLYLLTRADVRGFAQTGVDDVTAAMAGWKQVQQGSVWVPVINQTESANGIPTDLLARMAYQESHFRPDIISGIKTSSVGALGILQLMPQFFQTVNVPIPYTTSDVLAQISEAARYLQSLYNQFGDWGVAVAAYNDGPGNIRQYLAGNRDLPSETLDYVTGILSDVPVPSTLRA